MISLKDRRRLAHDSNTANTVGARLRVACDIAGINLRMLQRWKVSEGLVGGDGRPSAVHPTPSHALSENERVRLVLVVSEARFSAVPLTLIVPMLADEGIYLASESSFSRVLRKHGQSVRRGRAKTSRAVRPAQPATGCPWAP